MPGRSVAVDSGPLVALFDGGDAHHRRAVRFLRKLRGGLITNLAVLTEVVYLLDFSVEAQRDFLVWVKNGAVTVQEVLLEDLDRVVEILGKYANLPADFADACLLAQCERLGLREIATIDSDFKVYRMRGNRALRNVFPVTKA